MDTASLELSKELYELSGWIDSFWYNYDAHRQDANGRAVYEWFVEPRKLRFESQHSKASIPAYSLGYLLRKLAFVEAHVGYGRTAGWNVLWKRQHMIQSDTPEDALCKLAIELFKQGVLVKGAK